MGNPVILKVVEQMETLPDNLQEQVLGYVQTLKASGQPGVPDRHFLPFDGVILSPIPVTEDPIDVLKQFLHEFRAPIAAIQAYTTLMQLEAGYNRRSAQEILRITLNMEKILKLISDYLQDYDAIIDGEEITGNSALYQHKTDVRRSFISQSQPPDADFEAFLDLSRHPRWEVRFKAVRDWSLPEDARTVDILIDLLKNDPVDHVRNMAARVIGKLYEKGVEMPLYQDVGNPDPGSKVKVAIGRLRELKVKIHHRDDAYILKVPHELNTPECVEAGYLMAQLGDEIFPKGYSPLTDIPSLVVPKKENPGVEFRESYPDGLKYLVRLSRPE